MKRKFRRKSGRFLSEGVTCALVAAAVFSVALIPSTVSGQDHSEHNMGAQESNSESGDMHSGHDMSAELMDELREKVLLYREYSNQQIMFSMQMMGGNFPVYISDESVNGEIGVVLLAHGYDEKGDEKFIEAVSAVSGIFPTVAGIGMSMMVSDHLQLAVDRLVGSGAKKIVVIPIVATEHSTLVRQWQYIFGLLDEAAYATVPQVESAAEIVFAEPFNDDPLVAEMMIDWANTMSEDPANETVLIVAHGPSEEEDNTKVLAQLENLADMMRQDTEFSDVMAISLQDDSPTATRKENVKRLRSMAQEAVDNGQRVLIVTNLIAIRSIQHKIRDDLEGIPFTFNSKGLTAHPNFEKWLSETIRNELAL